MLRRFALLALAVLALASCGGTSGTGSSTTGSGCKSPTSFTFRLNWVLDDEQVPYYTALDKGWYRQACIDPHFQPGTGSNNTVQLVANGSAQMGVSDTISVIAGQAKGMGITGVGVVYQHNPTALLIRKASLTAAQRSAARPPLSMLYGKTYGAVITGSPYYFWKAFLKQQHLNAGQIKTVNIAAPGFTQMATGQVDFIATFFTTAPVLEGLGVPLKVLKMADYGQQAYGLSYLVNSSFMHQHANAIKAFLKVTARAIKYTNQHPEEGVKILCKYNKSICSSQKALETNVQEQKLQIPLYQNLQAGKPMFCTDAAVWKKTQELDLIAGAISKAPDPAPSFTNRFIDGC